MQLNEWIDNNKPDPNLYYAEAFYQQIENIKRATWCFVPPDERRPMWGASREALSVVGTHVSKSVKLPVYFLSTRGVEVWIRDNFYNYKVSIRSEQDIDDLDSLDIFNPYEKHEAVYCEGMSEVYGPYASSHKQFTLEIYGYGDLHTLFRLLNKKVPMKAAVP